MTARPTMAALVATLLAAGAAGMAAQGAPPAGTRFQIRARDTAQTTVVGRDLGAATQRFEVDGVPVIVRENPANDVVAANVYLLGGTRQLTPATQGIEALLLEASERGTRRYSREALSRALARTGSTISVSAGKDWTLVSLRTIRSELDSSWAVLTERITAARLDSADVELVRAQMVAAARQRRSSPDEHVAFIADSIAFAGHPYALSPQGTPGSLPRISLAELRRYRDREIVKSRLLVVVVGNVTRSKVETLVRKAFAPLPAGSYRWTIPPELPATPGTTIVPRALPTNYIVASYAGPAATHPDYAALRVASAVLSGSLFSEIRTRHNLTYAVDAPFVERAVSSGGLYVTTVAPDTTLALMRAELQLMRTELLYEAPLERLVQRFITDYFIRNETNADQASFLARAELYDGDYRAADDFVARLRAVTPADVRRVARTYMRDFRFVYLGDPARLDERRLRGF